MINAKSITIVRPPRLISNVSLSSTELGIPAGMKALIMAAGTK